MQWQGSTVVITGASRGIGRAIALAAAAKGARVEVIARDDADLKAVLAETGDRGALTAEIAALEVDLGPTDILVANAGIGVSMVNPGPVATHVGEARGHPYDRPSPTPVPAEQVATALIKAVERSSHEQYVPASLRGAVVIRHLIPPIFRFGSKKSFTRELADDRIKR